VYLRLYPALSRSILGKEGRKEGRKDERKACIISLIEVLIMKTRNGRNGTRWN
jgi:hypothetical protein